MTIQRSYGKTIHPFACPKPDSDAILLGGLGEDLNRWTRVLTQRAAKLLWYQLGCALYPENFREKTAQLTTLPIRSALLPSVTTDLRVDTLREDEFEVIGLGSASTWSTHLRADAAQQLWAALDDLLKA
ncbi:MAG: hypothetical protein U0670_00670 [Anaerolineae bacterium]